MSGNATSNPSLATVANSECIPPKEIPPTATLPFRKPLQDLRAVRAYALGVRGSGVGLLGFKV